MKAHWWSCVLGILCMPAEVVLSTWTGDVTVSQDPTSIYPTRLHSSAKIMCSTSVSDAMSLTLFMHFHGNREIIYLSLENGQVTKNTTNAEFKGRIHVVPDQEIRKGHKFNFQLSLLELEDTDLYYCQWSYFSVDMGLTSLSSNGTIIIVTERDSQEQCQYHILDAIFIALSVTALTVILFLVAGVSILRCTRFKKQFTPARDVSHSRPNRPPHVCPQQRVLECPYLITSESTLDFRGIL